MIIIASGRYIDEEMASELGRIPPSFLPVGNRRLYEHQINLFKGFNQKVLLTLPEDFDVPSYDLKWLIAAGVTIQKVAGNLTLGQSLHEALAENISDNESLFILFGDTLFSNLNLKFDFYSVGYQDEYYPWGVVKERNGEVIFTDGVDDVSGDSKVLSGLFSFKDAHIFADKLKVKNYSFFDALTSYAKSENFFEETMEGWLDFGHLHTYFKSKAKRTTERAFNSIEIKNRCVIKKSHKDEKLYCESFWFENIPKQLKIYTPIYLGSENLDGRFSYETEYLFLSTLSELFVHGKLPDKLWVKIFDSCFNFIDIERSIKPPTDISNSIEELLINKTNSRVIDIAVDERFCPNSPLKLNGRELPILGDLVSLLLKKIDRSNEYHTIMHGDFCFSNILYDFRVDAIKVIDPRGTLDGFTPSIYGDMRYDLAKFFHSIVGFYDLILANRYTTEMLNVNEFRFSVHADERQLAIRKLFLDAGLVDAGVLKQVLPVMILLFVSMVPLHADDRDRQLALLLNAYRLFVDLEEGF